MASRLLLVLFLLLLVEHQVTEVIMKNQLRGSCRKTDWFSDCAECGWPSHIFHSSPSAGQIRTYLLAKGSSEIDFGLVDDPNL